MTTVERRSETPLSDGFELLYRCEFAAVVAIAYALSGSRAVAEQLAQEAFLAAYRRWDVISAYDEPAAWVRRVRMNRSTSFVRRRVTEAKALARLGGRRVLLAELPPDAAAFWSAVRKLPKRQAQVVTLHYFEDMAVADIASSCNALKPR